MWPQLSASYSPIGAWADGSSWSKIIKPLVTDGVMAIAAPLPLTTFADDVAALKRAYARTGSGTLVLAGHAYAGAVIGAASNDKVKALVYVAALAPDEGETVADVFCRGEPIRRHLSSLPMVMA